MWSRGKTILRLRRVSSGLCPFPALVRRGCLRVARLGRSVQRRTVPINKERFASIYKEPLRGTLNRPPRLRFAQPPLLTKEGNGAEPHLIPSISRQDSSVFIAAGTRNSKHHSDPRYPYTPRPGGTGRGSESDPPCHSLNGRQERWRVPCLVRPTARHIAQSLCRAAGCVYIRSIHT
jgi:hypothetical protein